MERTPVKAGLQAEICVLGSCSVASAFPYFSLCPNKLLDPLESGPGQITVPVKQVEVFALGPRRQQRSLARTTQQVPKAAELQVPTQRSCVMGREIPGHEGDFEVPQ